MILQVTKSPKPVASCAMPAGPGMDIKTDTPLVKKAREGVMEFLLVCCLSPAYAAANVHFVLLCIVLKRKSRAVAWSAFHGWAVIADQSPTGLPHL